jgi:hypothetical protein
MGVYMIFFKNTFKVRIIVLSLLALNLHSSLLTMSKKAIRQNLLSIITPDKIKKDIKELKLLCICKDYPPTATRYFALCRNCSLVTAYKITKGLAKGQYIAYVVKSSDDIQKLSGSQAEWIYYVLRIAYAEQENIQIQAEEEEEYKQ